MSSNFLTAAARAYALVSLADGKPDWREANQFALRLRGDRAFLGISLEEMEAAATAAFATLKGDEAFEPLAADIAALVATATEREGVLRAAQAALVADGASHDQEEAALRVLAVALGLDPDKA